MRSVFFWPSGSRAGIFAHYMITRDLVIKAMLPLGLHMRLQQSYALTQQGAQCALDDLSPEQRRIWQKLHDAGKPVEQGAFLRCMGLTADSESLKTMLEQGVVEKQEQRAAGSPMLPGKWCAGSRCRRRSG